MAILSLIFNTKINYNHKPEKINMCVLKGTYRKSSTTANLL